MSQEGGCTLLLSAGDVFTGTPASDHFDARPDFLGYDAMAVGNHEFDKGLPVLRQREAEVASSFPMLSGNIVDQDGDLLFPGPGGQGQITFNIAGARITVWGLTTIDTKPGLESGVVVQPPVDIAKKQAKDLKQNTHVLIGLTHMGHYDDEKPAAEDLQKRKQGDEMMALENPGTFDLIVGGHSQQPLFEADQVADTFIVQAFEWGKYLGRIDITLPAKPKLGAKNIKSLDYRLIPINIRNDQGQCTDPSQINSPVVNCIDEDPQVLDILESFQNDEVIRPLYQVIGEARGSFSGERSVIRKQQAPLGQLVNESILDYVAARWPEDLRSYDEDRCSSRHFSVYNGGGIRATINKGDILGLDTQLVFPFGSVLKTSPMNGEALYSYFQNVAKIPYQPNSTSGDYPQLRGIQFVMSGKDLLDIRCRNSDGAWIPLNKEDDYTLTLNAYLFRGGDGGYPALNENPSVVTHPEAMADVFRRYIEQQLSLDPFDFAAPDAFLEGP
ncbi:5'-nucleotidase C-terminal domain-containing protein [Pseudobacteriovorax antillogorgiicola]|uniref:5'-nucleotidase / UDP-sugar diphosphatase n=1 Tax=Pseudobacteriovorax antillogorgiicola TaxID=1513793 RepID=A0A1Y6C459_9BACT|nr:5'-nucleotidase C-terminal domain-containing protein [Pseudobacteriovorax antillogorgiicola]TCS49882.1 5'-nucleotidase/UDP-sugar diphosphatase [Pseudobacteriovorax antillogorgiicola]SMF44433.1 5'-nucleotidase / UDP-sugar diphosphatase [Pseudobacteriovorax antillogorgiicola]